MIQIMIKIKTLILQTMEIHQLIQLYPTKILLHQMKH
jgi:hypothetical protein